MTKYIIASINHRGKTVRVDHIYSYCPIDAINEVELKNKLTRISYYQIL